jgi:hypothetical protein
MQTNYDDRHSSGQQLRQLIDAGAAPVTFAEIKARAERRAQAPQPARPERPGRHRRPALILTGAVAAVGSAAIIIAAVGGSGAGPAPGSVVTTALIRQVSSATKAALATSGQMVFVTVAHGYSTVVVGKPGHRHTYHPVSTFRATLSFAGKDNNTTYRGTTAATHGVTPAGTFMIARTVRGTSYQFFRGGPACRQHPSAHCDPHKPHWYRLIGKDVKRPPQADPRALLSLLAPTAHFKVAGHQVIDGVRTTELRATRLGGLAHLPPPANLALGTKPSRFLVWIDADHVVRRIVLKGRVAEHRGGHTTYPKRLSFVTQIDFRAIGIRQHIVAPAHAFPYHV